MRIEDAHYKNDLLAYEYMTYTRYLISFAQLLALRCSCTLTWCIPPSGSIKENMLTVPLRTYLELFSDYFWSLSEGVLLLPQRAGMIFNRAVNWMICVIGELIYIKNILRVCYEFRVFLCRDISIFFFAKSKFLWGIADCLPVYGVIQ